MASTNSEQEYTPQLPDEAPKPTNRNCHQTTPATTSKTLDWREHIRLRPGMYIGSLGDGSQSDDGVYVLLKEVLDNAIDEYMMGFRKAYRSDCYRHDHHCKGLRTRHTAGQNRRCQLKDEYRSEI